ncbi:MAG: UDP-glucose 4-epimerase [Bradymonadia bacterium]|jgi:UDP-glucose 4-epimerase
MRVLVTGGAGFIGSHLTDALCAEGADVRVLDDLSTGHTSNLAASPNAALTVGSVTDFEMVRRLAEGCEVIFHQAAIASVPRSIEDPRASHAVNVGGTVNVLEAARQAGVRRVVFAGSAAVYGTREGAVSESDAPAPGSPYAVEKLASEHYMRMWPGLFGVSTVTLRYFNVFGPRQDPSSPYSGVVSIFADRLRAGRPVTIFGDGEQTRDFVAVDDVVRANLAAAKAQLPGDGALVANVARGQATSLNMLYSALAELLDGPAEPAYGPTRAGDVRHSLANVERAREVLGFAAQTGIQDGLARILAAESA